MSAAQLLADLARLNVRLEVHGDRLRFHPRSAMTPELLDLMKAHKAELLVLLRPKRRDVAPRAAPPTQARPICRCGSTTWVDVPIHYGQSARRDCAACGRFIDFSRWYGTDALQAGE
jgi:hypothetical protein